MGIACNKMLSKICSEVNKPNGQTYLPFDLVVIEEFMNKRNIRDIPSVGNVMEQTLNHLGINKCGDVKGKLMHLFLNFSENVFEFLAKASLGIAKTQHEKDNTQGKKSICFMKSFRVISRYE